MFTTNLYAPGECVLVILSKCLLLSQIMATSMNRCYCCKEKHESLPATVSHHWKQHPNQAFSILNPYFNEDKNSTSIRNYISALNLVTSEETSAVCVLMKTHGQLHSRTNIT